MSDTGLPKGVILKNTYSIRRQIAVSNLTIVYLGFDKKKRQVCVIKEFFPQKNGIKRFGSAIGNL